MTLVYIFLGIVLWAMITACTFMVAEERHDGTSKVEVIILCIFISPILALILEMLKPYNPNKINKN